jgi:hypothetical protein
MNIQIGGAWRWKGVGGRASHCDILIDGPSCGEIKNNASIHRRYFKLGILSPSTL